LTAETEAPNSPYTLQENNGGYSVCAPTGRIIMQCKDKGSASHYAALLSEAYRTGYKQGYKDHRNHSTSI